MLSKLIRPAFLLIFIFPLWPMEWESSGGSYAEKFWQWHSVHETENNFEFSAGSGMSGDEAHAIGNFLFRSDMYSVGSGNLSESPLGGFFLSQRAYRGNAAGWPWETPVGVRASLGGSVFNVEGFRYGAQTPQGWQESSLLSANWKSRYAGASVYWLMSEAEREIPAASLQWSQKYFFAKLFFLDESNYEQTVFLKNGDHWISLYHFNYEQTYPLSAEIYKDFSRFSEIRISKSTDYRFEYADRDGQARIKTSGASHAFRWYGIYREGGFLFPGAGISLEPLPFFVHAYFPRNENMFSGSLGVSPVRDIKIALSVQRNTTGQYYPIDPLFFPQDFSWEDYFGEQELWSPEDSSAFQLYWKHGSFQGYFIGQRVWKYSASPYRVALRFSWQTQLR